MRRTTALLAAAAMAVAGLGLAPAPASAAPDDLPLGARVDDARGDATHGSPEMRRFADTVEVSYRMPRSEDGLLRISVRYPRLAPVRVRQRFATTIDVPGDRDWRIEVSDRRDVVVRSLDPDRDGPRVVTVERGYSGGSGASDGSGSRDIGVSTEWLDAPRARFTTRSRAGARAVDVTRTSRALDLTRD